jgi:hypothetical protein
MNLLKVQLDKKRTVHVVNMLGNSLHTHTTLTCFGEHLQYLLIVGQRSERLKKGWYAMKAYQPFYASFEMIKQV